MKRKALALFMAIIAVVSIAFTAAAEGVSVPDEVTTTSFVPSVPETTLTTTEGGFLDGAIDGSVSETLEDVSNNVVNGMFSIQNILQAIVDTIENIKQAIVKLLGSFMGGLDFIGGNS